MEIIAVLSSILGLSALGTTFKFIRDISNTKKKCVEVNKRGIKLLLSQNDVRCVNCVNNPNKASLDLNIVVKGNFAPEDGEKLQVVMEKAAAEAIETIKR